MPKYTNLNEAKIVESHYLTLDQLSKVKYTSKITFLKVFSPIYSQATKIMTS